MLQPNAGIVPLHLWGRRAQVRVCVKIVLDARKWWGSSWCLFNTHQKGAQNKTHVPWPKLRTSIIFGPQDSERWGSFESHHHPYDFG